MMMSINTCLRWLSACFVVMMMAAGLHAQDVQRPEASVPRTDKAPFIDGDLSDPCWGKSVVLPDFYIFQGGGKTTDALKVRVMHDDTWIYFAFDIKLPHPEVIDGLELEPDGNLSAYDSVEVFFDPGTGGETYLHYMLSAGNVRGERRCTEGGRSRETMWNVPWRSATQRTDDGWQAEVAIPLAVLEEHGSLKGLTMNVGANRILSVLNEFGVPISARRETSSWAPAPRGFHDPVRFGIVKGVDKLKPATPMLVSLQKVRTGSYRVDDDGSFYYNVSGAVKGYTSGSGKVLAVVEDMPGEGDGETVSVEVAVEQDKPGEFSIDVPVTILSDRTAELTLRDPETGEVFQFMPLRDMAGLSLMRSYVRYSYYTTEKFAQVVCELGLPAEELGDMRLVVLDEAGKTLAEEAGLSSKVYVDVPIRRFLRSGLADGEHVWTVELRRSTGEVAVSQKVAMVKRKPNPGCEWKIDWGEGRILNNGKPFFPFGIMAMIPAADQDASEMMAKDLSDMGFNTIVRWGRDPVANLDRIFELAEKHDFYVVDFPVHWRFEHVEGQNPPEPDEGTDAVTASGMLWEWIVENRMAPELKKIVNNPRLMAYYLWDEPQQRLELHAAIEQLNKGIYAIDGYRPTEVLYIPPVPVGELYSRNCDILGVDPYWVPGGGVGDLGNPNIVGRHTWLARRRADRDLKLAWITPCAEQWSGTRMRIYSEKEQRVQTYLSLIHGAHGLLYFVYPFKSQVSYDAFKGLGEEMKVIGPAMAAGEVPQIIEASPVGFDPANNIFPDVQVSLKRNPGGGYILLAANWRPYPVEVSYTISILGESGRVTGLFGEKKVFEVSGSVFADRFDAMDTRAYSIPGPAQLADIVEIKVDVKAVPEQADRFYTKVGLPDGGAPGRKNVLRNSGFEDSSIPGMADYYHDMRTKMFRPYGWRVGDSRGDVGAGVCTENPFEGKHSMRIQAQGTYGFLLFWVRPDVTKPTPFVFSAWVRGDTPGSRVSFYGPVDSKTRAHTVSEEWTRISTTGTVFPQPTSQENSLFGFNVVPLKGGTNTVWIDAMQFELGEELTDYEP